MLATICRRHRTPCIARISQFGVPRDFDSPPPPESPTVVATVPGQGALPAFPDIADEIPAFRFDEHDVVVELTDAELEQAVRKANGHVIIGLKAPAAPRSSIVRSSAAMSRAEVLAARSALEGAGVKPYASFRYTSAVVARIDPASARAVRTLPFVDYVEPDRMGRVETASVVGSVSLQDTTWGVWRIRAPEVWDGSLGPSNGGQGVHVTIIDSGLDEILSLNGDGPLPNGSCLYTVQSVDPVQGPHCYANDGYHGAYIGGIIAAADNNEGIIGVAPELQGFTSIKICRSASECPLSSLHAALDWAISLGHPRHIVNISMGWCVPFYKDLRRTFQEAVESGILVVAAVGNAWSNVNDCEPGGDVGTTEVKYPARFGEVLAVSGVDDNDSFVDPPEMPSGPNPPPPEPPCNDPDNLDPSCPPVVSLSCSKGSRSGPEIELAAPHFALSLGRDGAYAYDCGTSGAAAFVSAAAALVWSRNPSFTSSQVRDLLKEHAVPLGSSTQFGAGRIDVAAAAYPAPPPPPPLSAQIVGPDFIVSPGQHTWNASVSGGVGGYAYAWSWSTSSSGGPFSSLGTDPSVQMLVNEGSVPQFWLRLVVTSGSVTTTSQLRVLNETNNPCAPLVCLQTTAGVP